MERLHARERWMRWALAAGASLALAAIDPPWLRPALVVVCMLGLFGVTNGRSAAVDWYRHRVAFRQWPDDRPVGPIRHTAPIVVVIGAALLAFEGPGQSQPRLQAVALAVGLAGVTDLAVLASRTETWLAERQRSTADRG